MVGLAMVEPALDVSVQVLADALGGAKIIEVLLGAAFGVIDAVRLVADDEGARHRVVTNARRTWSGRWKPFPCSTPCKPTGKYVGRAPRHV